ncbi:XdhC family aldehyde oxidoreductase maturation factor [Desulforhopalus singaporensis]|uniref:Xanthine dehydrogenase accessory factor n=1 Tax=Desulforhopalus singaporensis TaxID=91360 RepID=A0A1H0LTY5_9BACT|nr:XdhC/CoxI family protein [Desulforhopalus singaporensis]SDO71446.1 xanthine dehydrogenase accessory factor [Desulforhopalus singaporensis]
MHHLLDTLIETLESGELVILGGIVRSSGSAPRTSGARMLVRRDGTICGTVGGGAVEAKCLEAAGEMFAGAVDHKVVEFSMSASALASEGMVCGGAVSILLQKIDGGKLDFFKRLQTLCRDGGRPMLLTVLPGGLDDDNTVKMMLGDRESVQQFGPGFYESLVKRAGRVPFLTRVGDAEIFVEPLASPGVVHMVGAGHVAHATAKLAAFAGFEVVVIDDRTEFANKDRYPEAREIRVVDSFDSCLGQMSGDDYVVIVTRGHLHDKDVLAQALRTDAGYIGMIGSRRKRNVIYDTLRQEGFSETDLKRVYSPIGLCIGADTPNEIALSIVGELVQVRARIGAK